jgi:predicted protein tyrosine phosphatase
MSSVLVAPLAAVPSCIRLYNPSHLVTLLSHEYMIETPVEIEPQRHLKLAIDDIVEPWSGRTHASEADVTRLLEFGREWDGSAPMLIHCWAGVSRSTAAAFTVLCDRLGPGCEIAVARGLREKAPHADPNRLVVRIADSLLGRNGNMVRAIELIGRGTLVVEGTPVQLPLLVGSP